MKENSFIITYTQLGPALNTKILTECNNSQYWHKFIIMNVKGYTDDFILKTVLDFLYPVRLTPVNFARNKKSAAFFLASNCLDAIMKFVTAEMKLVNPLNVKCWMKITIIANFCEFDTFNVRLESNVKHIVQKRFSNKTVDLRDFHNDPDLKENCMLSDPKSLAFVIHFLINLEPKKIILSGNFIKSLTPLTLLGKHSLISVDLQDNQITCVRDLIPLRHFPALQEISLNENPICEGLTQDGYISTLKKFFPKLKIVDGVAINELSKVLLPKDNFLCSRDAGDLVEQFLEYFFTVYDRDDRSGIIDLYHKNAMFSASCRIIPGQVTEKTSRLNHYFAINRSLHTRFGTGHKDKCLFQGREKIMELYKALPRSYHDPYTLKIDLIYFTKKLAVIVVYGVFREEQQYFGFTRNFVLECDYKQRYCIKNEQLHVYNALDDQVINSFEKPQRIEFTGAPIPFLFEQYSELQETVKLITNLNSEYCRRILEEFHYDLKTVLKNFMDRHIKNEIPEEAFIQDKNHDTYNKKTDNPHSNELIGRTIKTKGLLSKKNVWQMLTDEKIAMTTNQHNTNIGNSETNHESVNY